MANLPNARGGCRQICAFSRRFIRRFIRCFILAFLGTSPPRNRPVGGACSASDPDRQDSCPGRKGCQTRARRQSASASRQNVEQGSWCGGWRCCGTSCSLLWLCRRRDCGCTACDPAGQIGAPARHGATAHQHRLPRRPPRRRRRRRRRRTEEHSRGRGAVCLRRVRAGALAAELVQRRRLGLPRRAAAHAAPSPRPRARCRCRRCLATPPARPALVLRPAGDWRGGRRGGGGRRRCGGGWRRRVGRRRRGGRLWRPPLRACVNAAGRAGAARRRGGAGRTGGRGGAKRRRSPSLRQLVK